MLALKNILFARDFSPASEAALPFALALAERTGAKLHVLYAEVLQGDPFHPAERPTPAAEKLRERMRQWTERAASPVFDPGSVRVEHAVVRGVAAAPALLDYAEEHAVDLVVMGTHGRRGARRALLGSVAEETVRFAPCPVLTVRQTSAAAEADVAAAPRVTSILVPVDFSEHAREALRHAKGLGALFGARLDLLHVIEAAPEPLFYVPLAEIGRADEPEGDLDRKALAHLRRWYEATEGPATEVRFAVRYGNAPQEILQHAEEHTADLVVIATHGRTGLERFFMGSVAEKVVRRAPCPVFTLKSFGKTLTPTPEGRTSEGSASEPVAETNAS